MTTHGVDERLRSSSSAIPPSPPSTLPLHVLLSSLLSPPSSSSSLGILSPGAYCDWTASGAPSSLVEDYVRLKVLPTYANTHSLESRNGLQTSCFREESREIVQLACNGNRKKDVVVFVGNGVTGAINRLVGVLGLRDGSVKCVVFVGAHEHHSNLLPWRESNARVVVVPEDEKTGRIDLGALESLLDLHGEDLTVLRIGSFSACSNVTGILEDVDAVSSLLHRKGALAFWDYATAAPYVDIDMNPVDVANPNDRPFVQKDAVFVSSHKFVGGVGGSGVLIAKKFLFKNRVPNETGGGTVYFVTDRGHRFLSDTIDREEGGTPNILGAIRAGLAFKIKQSVGVEVIAKSELAILARARAAFAKVQDVLVVFGLLDNEEFEPPSTATTLHRLPIFSFLIRKNGRFLHHKFVAAVLNDVYGIQSRGGCMCAGPYVQRLLGMTTNDVERVESVLVGSVHECEQLRPGVTRVSLPYFFNDALVDFVLNAICDVAVWGWRLLPLYRFDNVSGEWGLRVGFQKFPQRIWLANVFQDLEALKLVEKDKPSLLLSFEETLAAARELMQNPFANPMFNSGMKTMESATPEDLRWFVLSSEALSELESEKQGKPVNEELICKSRMVIEPNRFRECALEHSRACMLQSGSGSGNVVLKDPMEQQPSVFSASLSLSKRDKKQPKRSTIAFDVPVHAAVDEEEQQPLTVVVAQASLFVKEMTTAELFPRIPSPIMKLVVQASKQWGMINPGDKVLLGLSGGKDSLCLLHVLLQMQKNAPFRFELACCTIDPGAGDAFDPKPLIPYVKSLGVEYFFETTEIFQNALVTLPPGAGSYCSYCARMKRGTLYRVAKENGFTALALAQHLDDFAESFLMSAFRNGALRTMKANYIESKGDVRVIRPLCYVREHLTRDFSYKARLPVINENCPACFAAPSERARIKKLLKEEEEASGGGIFENLKAALTPLMAGESYSAFQAVNQKLRAAELANPATRNAKSYGQTLATSGGKRKIDQTGDGGGGSGGGSVVSAVFAKLATSDDDVTTTEQAEFACLDGLCNVGCGDKQGSRWGGKKKNVPQSFDGATSPSKKDRKDDV